MPSRTSTKIVISRNAKTKFKISEKDAKAMMRDIFGRPNHKDGTYQKGIVDFESVEEMEEAFKLVRSSWTNKGFGDCFARNCLSQLAEKISPKLR